MFIEKRAHPRFQAAFPVKYCLVNDPSEANAIREKKGQAYNLHFKKDICFDRKI